MLLMTFLMHLGMNSHLVPEWPSQDGHTKTGRAVTVYVLVHGWQSQEGHADIIE